jgi:hypothetical protein
VQFEMMKRSVMLELCRIEDEAILVAKTCLDNGKVFIDDRLSIVVEEDAAACA